MSNPDAALLKKQKQKETWQALAESLDCLCTCYRLERRPAEALLTKISALREKLEILEG